MDKLALAYGGQAALGVTADILGGIKSSQAAGVQAAAIQNNANMSRIEAKQSLDLGKLNILQQKKALTFTQGKTRAAAGSSGALVGEGSPVDVLAANAGEAARIEEITRFNTEYKSWAKEWEAYNQDYQAYAIQASAPTFGQTALNVGMTLGTAAIGYYGAK